jgi:hypothetical protein
MFAGERQASLHHDEDIRLSRQSIDDIAGVPAGYSAKLLSPKPIKKLGGLSIDVMLPALGIKLLQRRTTALLNAGSIRSEHGGHA